MESGNTRRCTQCGESKDLDNFYYCGQGLLGLMSRCRACHKKNVTERRRKLFAARRAVKVLTPAQRRTLREELAA